MFYIFQNNYPVQTKKNYTVPLILIAHNIKNFQSITRFLAEINLLNNETAKVKALFQCLNNLREYKKIFFNFFPVFTLTQSPPKIYNLQYVFEGALLVDAHTECLSQIEDMVKLVLS